MPRLRRAVPCSRTADTVVAMVQADAHKYVMTISRLTLDKLGIQLYDRIAAVLAELIANAYDADANNVEVHLPMGRLLTDAKGADLGLDITVTDDGTGIAPDKVNEYYLTVGGNRRARPDFGETTAQGRHVMGRKGIGKLAPFGVCREIEVRTAGGERTPHGFAVSHFVLRYDAILSETDSDYYPVPAGDDGTWAPTPGTRVVLRDFLKKQVPRT
jgi:Histidine kinase-, DNA gyrase B-, and HSP90-like ATPase